MVSRLLTNKASYATVVFFFDSALFWTDRYSLVSYNSLIY